MIDPAGYLGSVASACPEASDETLMLLETTDRVLREGGSIRRFRGGRGSSTFAAQRGNWPEFCSLGLIGACMPTSAGGSGLSLLSGVLLTETFGRNLAPEPYVAAAFVPTALLGQLQNAQAGSVLADTAAGKIIPVVALQEAVGNFHFAAPATRAARVAQGLCLSGHKRFVHGAAWATHFLVSARLDDSLCIALVAVDAPGVGVQERSLADGTLSADLSFDNVALAETEILAHGDHCIDMIGRSVGWAHLAISAELFGLVTALFGMTIEYLRTRTQFDQPIGSFQALQHRAADLYCSKEIARFTIAQAAQAFADEPSSQCLAIASRCKARAAETALQIAREAVQLHGAIGFSDECDVGLYLRRILVLSAWLGGADHHRRVYARLNPYRID